MPRDGTNTYNLPFPDVVAGTTIASPVYNGFTHDIAQDLNTPRPISAGGTGATSADGALTAMGGEKAQQLVTNYDSHAWLPGSFYSDISASGEPVNGHAFSGIIYQADSNNIVVEARDSSDGKLYIRRKVAGSWGSWTLEGDLSGVSGDVASRVLKAGDTMTGKLLMPATGGGDGATTATTKGYVDTALALKADLNAPAFTGNPTAITPPLGNNTVRLATTAYVDGTVSSEVTRADNAYQAKDAQLFAGIPIVALPHTFALTSAQKGISGTGTATIPANGSIAFPVGTCLSFFASGGTMSIAITSDTLNWYNGTSILTGTRTLASGAVATAVKIASTTWALTGNGLT